MQRSQVIIEIALAVSTIHSGYRQIIRNSEPELPDPLAEAHRHLIVETEDRCRVQASLHENIRGQISLFKIMVRIKTQQLRILPLLLELKDSRVSGEALPRNSDLIAVTVLFKRLRRQIRPHSHAGIHAVHTVRADKCDLPVTQPVHIVRHL